MKQKEIMRRMLAAQMALTCVFTQLPASALAADDEVGDGEVSDQVYEEYTEDTEQETDDFFDEDFYSDEDPLSAWGSYEDGYYDMSDEEEIVYEPDASAVAAAQAGKGSVNDKNICIKKNTEKKSDTAYLLEIINETGEEGETIEASVTLAKGSKLNIIDFVKKSGSVDKEFKKYVGINATGQLTAKKETGGKEVFVNFSLSNGKKVKLKIDIMKCGINAGLSELSKINNLTATAYKLDRFDVVLDMPLNAVVLNPDKIKHKVIDFIDENGEAVTDLSKAVYIGADGKYHVSGLTTKSGSTKISFVVSGKKIALNIKVKGNDPLGGDNDPDAASHINLGGMTIIVRDWWSNPKDNEMTSPQNDYDRAVKKYREEAMKKYNFKFKRMAISDWGTAPKDFYDYAMAAKDKKKNYVFVLRSDSVTASAMQNGLMYDLSQIDTLDFNDVRYTRNGMHLQYSYKGGIYGMSAEGYTEPTEGLYFNKDLLRERGVDPDTIYDMQKEGTWTWAAWEEIMSKVQGDTDGDGVNDIFGVTGNQTLIDQMGVLSNGGELVGLADGKYTCRLDDEQTVEGLKGADHVIRNYFADYPDDVEWDYYKTQFRSGYVAFCVDAGYAATSNNVFDGVDFDLGFVMYPAGPRGSMVNRAGSNVAVIPSFYDKERARKIAFAYDIWYSVPEEYADYNSFIAGAGSGSFDQRALNETLPLMCVPENVKVTYHEMIPDLEVGPLVYWKVDGKHDVDQVINDALPEFRRLIEQANGE